MQEVRKPWGALVVFSLSFEVRTRPRVAFARSRAYQIAFDLVMRSLFRKMRTTLPARNKTAAAVSRGGCC
jgi:hypothetical protein